MDGLAFASPVRRVRLTRPAPRRRFAPYRGVVMTPGCDPESVAARRSDAAELIEAIAARQDRHAFGGLFEMFAPRVKGYLMSLGTSPQAAEELAQEALLAVWRKAQMFDRRRAGASTWIFTIARNLRIDAARKERSALAYAIDLSEEPDGPEQPDAVLDGTERESAVREALATLTPEQATVVRMSFFQEKPQSEIAAELGIPLGTVKSRVRLAMGRLRERLEDLL